MITKDTPLTFGKFSGQTPAELAQAGEKNYLEWGAANLRSPEWSEAFKNALSDIDEDKVLDAEIATIKANQDYINSNKDEIEALIEKLDDAIDRYSHRSRSSTKFSMAQDRALLAHSLDNAEIPVERLTELQVRGLAAAVRLLSAARRPRYWTF